MSPISFVLRWGGVCVLLVAGFLFATAFPSFLALALGGGSGAGLADALARMVVGVPLLALGLFMTNAAAG